MESFRERLMKGGKSRRLSQMRLVELSGLQKKGDNQ